MINSTQLDNHCNEAFDESIYFNRNIYIYIALAFLPLFDWLMREIYVSWNKIAVDDDRSSLYSRIPCVPYGDIQCNSSFYMDKTSCNVCHSLHNQHGDGDYLFELSCFHVKQSFLYICYLRVWWPTTVLHHRSVMFQVH